MLYLICTVLLEVSPEPTNLGILNRAPHGPDLCVGSTPAWTAPLIFEPRCLTVLGPCACRYIGFAIAVCEFNRRFEIHLDGAAATEFQENL